THEASTAATEASAALPPSARISIPARVVAGCPAATPASITAGSLQVVNAATELPLVHARGLVKRFGELVAVDPIGFDVQKGEAFGFLGPNGAGKSSTMRMIGCVSPPSGGTLRVLGLDPVKNGAHVRARLGVVPQEDTLDMELTVRENMLIYGRYCGLPRKLVNHRASRLLDLL